MAKYIDREALIAWLKRIPIKDLSEGLGLCRIIMEEDFKRAIRELPGEMIVDVEPEGWISVKDKLLELEPQLDIEAVTTEKTKAEQEAFDFLRRRFNQKK